MVVYCCNSMDIYQCSPSYIGHQEKNTHFHFRKSALALFGSTLFWHFTCHQ